MDGKRVEAWCALVHEKSPSTPARNSRRILGEAAAGMQRRKFSEAGYFDADRSDGTADLGNFFRPKRAAIF
jgi:hypothetical protein